MGLRILHDGAGAGEWRAVAVGILRVVEQGRLIDAADIDRPAVARLQAQCRAPAADPRPVAVILVPARIVDIAALGDAERGDAQGHGRCPPAGD